MVTPDSVVGLSLPQNAVFPAGGHDLTCGGGQRCGATVVWTRSPRWRRTGWPRSWRQPESWMSGFLLRRRGPDATDAALTAERAMLDQALRLCNEARVRMLRGAVVRVDPPAMAVFIAAQRSTDHGVAPGQGESWRWWAVIVCYRRRHDTTCCAGPGQPRSFSSTSFGNFTPQPSRVPSRSPIGTTDSATHPAQSGRGDGHTRGRAVRSVGQTGLNDARPGKQRLVLQPGIVITGRWFHSARAPRAAVCRCAARPSRRHGRARPAPRLTHGGLIIRTRPERTPGMPDAPRQMDPGRLSLLMDALLTEAPPAVREVFRRQLPASASLASLIRFGRPPPKPTI